MTTMTTTMTMTVSTTTTMSTITTLILGSKAFLTRPLASRAPRTH
jgi:hypothetical protein